jgi:hypothetical protein
MSVQPLRPAPRVPEEVAHARSSVRSAAAVPVGTLGVDDLAEAIQATAALEAQVAALHLRLVAEADRRKVAESLGATGADAWVAALTGSTRAVVAGGLWLARRLEETYDATRQAFAAGAISQAQARVVVEASDRLPEAVSQEQRAFAEAGLVAKAVGGMDPRRLRQAARRMVEGISRDLADQHEAQLLEAEERRAEVETWLSLHDNGDGTFAGRFVIPELHGHLLRSALERLTSPQRLSRNRAGELTQDDTLIGDAPRLSWSEQLGRGFTELLEHLPSEASGGFSRVGVGVLVHIDLKHLLDGLGSARLDTGVHVSAGEARRLACNAGIIPAVLDGRSEPLDLGYEARLHSTAMRRALSIGHESCAAEGCQRPFAWCDVHHPHAWSHGGRTSLANAVPLCPWHHQRAHDRRFGLDLLASGEVRYRRRT